MSLKGGIAMLGIDHQHGRFGSESLEQIRVFLEGLAKYDSPANDDRKFMRGPSKRWSVIITRY